MLRGLTGVATALILFSHEALVFGQVVIDVPSDLIPESVRGEVELNLFEGGVLDSDYRVLQGGALNIRGGTVGNRLYAEGDGTVNVFDGSVGLQLTAETGGVVNIYGGTIGDGLSALVDSTVEISGGFIGDNFASGGSLTIKGGSIGDHFGNFGDAIIGGGTFGEHFSTFERSALHFVGTEFYLDGESIIGLDSPVDSHVLATRDATLTGTFLDGTEFSFDLNSEESDASHDFFHPDAYLRLTVVPEPAGMAVFFVCVVAVLSRQPRPDDDDNVAQ